MIAASCVVALNFDVIVTPFSKNSNFYTIFNYEGINTQDTQMDIFRTYRIYMSSTVLDIFHILWSYGISIYCIMVQHSIMVHCHSHVPQLKLTMFTKKYPEDVKDVFTKFDHNLVWLTGGVKEL